MSLNQQIETLQFSDIKNKEVNKLIDEIQDLYYKLKIEKSQFEEDKRRYEIEKNNIILDDILKDSVHTNNKGGQIYGDIVYKWFIKNLGNLKLCQVDIPKNKFYEIKNVKFDNPIIIYDDYEFKGSVSYFIIYLEKSHHSGIIYFNNNI